jgi:hypothetical protein
MLVLIVCLVQTFALKRNGQSSVQLLIDDKNVCSVPMLDKSVLVLGPVFHKSFLFKAQEH